MSIVKKVVVATMAAVAVSTTLAGAAIIGAKNHEPINNKFDSAVTGVQNFGKGAMNKVSKVFNKNSQKSEVKTEPEVSKQ